MLRPDAEAFSRISNWLTACLDDVARGDADPSTLLDLADIVHEFVLSTKVRVPEHLHIFL